MAVSNSVEESALTIAWSLWAELGVRSVVRNHQDCSVDPEALLLLTAWLAAEDPRLRDESLDCLHELIPYIWTSRLKNLLRVSSPQARERFEKYGSTFNAHSKSASRLPTETGTPPWVFQRTHKTRDMRFDAQSLIYFRARALFGVGVKADAIVHLLCARRAGWLASQLCRPLGIAKRVVANVLLDFEQAGLMRSVKEANRLRYQLAKESAMEQLLAPLPARHPNWPLIVFFITAVQTHQEAEIEHRIRATDAINAFVAGSLEQGISTPVPSPGNRMEDLQTWVDHQVREIAKGTSPVLGSENLSLQDSDGLTGLRNRRRLMTDLAAELERGSRFAIALLDIRQFKHVNDRYGHAMGDLVLQRISAVLKGLQFASRFGGEEFVVALEDNDLDRIEQWATELLAKIEISANDLLPFPLRMWMGVVVVNPVHELSLDKILSAADQAMFESKEAKRPFTVVRL